jgi:SMC interacting uncharacterized protein involved in chromosome segregation
MTDIDKMAAELKQKRDELALQVKLGSMEAKQEFDELEKKFNDFAAKAKVEETASGVSSALSALGEELKKGYERLTKAL